MNTPETTSDELVLLWYKQKDKQEGIEYTTVGHTAEKLHGQYISGELQFDRALITPENVVHFSKIIELMLLGLPLPLLIKSTYKNDNCDPLYSTKIIVGSVIVDAIVAYIEGEFALQGTDNLPFFENLTFNQLPVKAKRYLRNVDCRAASFDGMTDPLKTIFSWVHDTRLPPLNNNRSTHTTQNQENTPPSIAQSAKEKPNITTIYICNVCGTHYESAEEAVECSKQPTPEKRFPLGSYVYNGNVSMPVFGLIVGYESNEATHKLVAIVNNRLKNELTDECIRIYQDDLELHTMSSCVDPDPDSEFPYRLMQRDYCAPYLVTPRGIVCCKGDKPSGQWILVEEGKLQWSYGSLQYINSNGYFLTTLNTSLNQWIAAG
jgi:hypothetical protein